MSLYNMMHGMHPFAAALVTCLGFEKFGDVPRFRDCFIFQDEIRILTRTGGGNREEYAEQNRELTERDGYIRDWDDPFDSTFAWWAFAWPETHRDALQAALEATEKHAPHLFPESLKESFDNLRFAQ